MKLLNNLLLVCFVILSLSSCAAEQQPTTLPDRDIWNAQEYSQLQKQWSVIEKRIKNDPSPSLSTEELDMLTTLFFQSVDGRNPNPNYLRSYAYVEQILRLGGGSSSEFHSWNLVLTEFYTSHIMTQHFKYKIEELSVAVDSLETELGESSSTISRLRREVRILRDSVASQKEVIEKLKKLEMLMEQERKRFQ